MVDFDNEDDLYAAIKSGKIAYCGIDVFVKEPATDNKLLNLENISVTPHLGANTLRVSRENSRSSSYKCYKCC